MFTKQHYKTLAYLLAEFKEDTIHKHTLVMALHVLFEKDNSRFDSNKWQDACYADTLWHY